MSKQEAPRRLNLGCGHDIKAGWTNLDSAPLPGVDIVHDLNSLPLPFEDGSFDHVLCQDVLEHVEYIPLLREIHRILAHSGTVAIRVPHFTSRNNFIDPTHKKRFSVETFDFFVHNTRTSKGKEREYYFDFHFSAKSSAHLTFERWSKFLILNRLVEPIVNRSPRAQRLYEASGWSRLFPAENILVLLTK